MWNRSDYGATSARECEGSTHGTSRLLHQYRFKLLRELCPNGVVLQELLEEGVEVVICQECLPILKVEDRVIRVQLALFVAAEGEQKRPPVNHKRGLRIEGDVALNPPSLCEKTFQRARGEVILQ